MMSFKRRTLHARIHMYISTYIYDFALIESNNKSVYSLSVGYVTVTEILIKELDELVIKFFN